MISERSGCRRLTAVLTWNSSFSETSSRSMR